MEVLPERITLLSHLLPLFFLHFLKFILLFYHVFSLLQFILLLLFHIHLLSRFLTFLLLLLAFPSPLTDTNCIYRSLRVKPDSVIVEFERFNTVHTKPRRSTRS